MALPSSDVNAPHVPERDELLKRLDQYNAGATTGMAFRWILLFVAAVMTPWAWILQTPIFAGVFLLVLLGRYAHNLLPIIARKRKRVRDLRPETTLGVHDRESLLGLVRSVEQQLEIPADRYPVYLVRDKSLNAAAVSLGLDSLFGRVDGVYLHRQTLHVLGPAELAFVIGHELGHCHRYYLQATRWEALNLLVAAVAGFALLPMAAQYGWAGIVGLGLLAAGGLGFVRFTSLHAMRTIEHLCDDYGAQAAGVVNAVNAMLKIGAESEGAARVTRFCIEMGRQRSDLDPLELMEEYERTVPFGKLDKSEADRVLAQSVQKVQQRNGKISLKGFLEYLSDEEVDEGFVDEMAGLWKRLDNTPTIDWAKPLRESGAEKLTAEQIDQVVAALEANPKALLSRAPEELIPNSRHPPTRPRVLYLWKNRRAIEAAS